LDSGISALAGLIAGSVVAVAFAAFKLIEKFIHKGSAWNESDRQTLKTVFDIITRVDTDGTPLAYMPRRVISVMENQTELMRKQHTLIEALTSHLISHEDREEKILEEIRDAIRMLGNRS
jgi:hypothetical protein